MLQSSSIYNVYIGLIIVVKLSFLYFAIRVQVDKFRKKDYSEALYWKDRLEFVFVFLMSCLLIYLFNPRRNSSLVTMIYIGRETQILLYIFGFILLLSANWNLFIHDSKIFHYLYNISN